MHIMMWPSCFHAFALLGERAGSQPALIPGKQASEPLMVIVLCWRDPWPLQAIC